MSSTRLHSNLALPALAGTQFVLILDSAVINVALATVGADFGVSAAGLTWVVNAYLLAFGGFLLLGGRLSDLLGARRMFLLGVLVFASASAAGGAAPSADWLIAARAVQGLGAALAAPSVLALVMELHSEGRERYRALAVLGAVSGAGGASGLIVGGVLTQLLGWRAVLWINVPLAAALIAAGMRALPISERPKPTGGFDLRGAVLATAALTSLVYAAVDADNLGVRGEAALIGFACLLGTLFIVNEGAVTAPLLPLEFVRSRKVLAANAAAAATAAAMFPMWFLITLLAQRVMGFGPLQAGLTVLPLSLVLILTNAVAPRVIGRFGFATAIAGGLLGAGAGFIWLAQNAAGQRFTWAFLFPFPIIGVGLGLAFAGSLAAATTGVPPDKAGLAGGLVNTSQQVGGAIGLAVLLGIAAARTHAAQGHLSPIWALDTGLRSGLLAAGAVAVAGAVLAASTLSGDRRDTALTRADHQRSAT